MTLEEATQELRVTQKSNNDSPRVAVRRQVSATSPIPHTNSEQTEAIGTAPPTFFDGSYGSVAARSQDRDTAADDTRTRHLFEYSLPGWSALYNSTLVVLDMLMTLISAAIILVADPDAITYLRSHPIVHDGLLEYLVVICLSWIASLGVSHIFERHTMGEGYDLYNKIYRASIINFIFLATFSYLLHLDIPRILTIGVPLLTAIFTTIERWLMRRALQRNRRKGEYNYPTVIVGSPEGIRHTLELLAQHKELGYAPIAVCPVAAHHDDAEDSDHDGNAQHLASVPFKPVHASERDLRVLPMNSHLPQTARYLKATTVMIADVIDRYSETMRTLSLAVESMGIELAFSSSVADLDGATLHLRNHPSMPIFTARLPQYSLMTKMCKRVFDILGSCIALILASPIMAYVAIRVKSEDGGPAIYKQERIGLYGKPFTLYKFRSMTVHADKEDAALAEKLGADHGILFKPKNDPRITPFGHFIRKTSLDELPQLVNVLVGNMSLVGPRPQQQYEVDQYGTLYSSRLLVKPGITGPWQISGRSDLGQKESEQLDVSYIQNWSLTGDIAILAKTVGAVVRGTGSY